MAEADPYPKIRRLVTRLLNDGLKPFRFSQYRSTAYFIRDRDAIRDTLFFQKMRSSSVAIAYGPSLVPREGDWTPGIKICRWLDNQAFYNAKYEEHAVASITRALVAFQREALPWFVTFNSVADLE